MGSFRGQLGKRKTLFYKRFVPKPGPMPGSLTQCFRCKSNEHSVKACPELRKRRKCAPVPNVPVSVLISKSHETPTMVPSVLEKVPVFVNAPTVEVVLETAVGSLNTVVLVPASKTDETPVVVDLDLDEKAKLERDEADRQRLEDERLRQLEEFEWLKEYRRCEAIVRDEADRRRLEAVQLAPPPWPSGPLMSQDEAYRQHCQAEQQQRRTRRKEAKANQRHLQWPPDEDR